MQIDPRRLAVLGAVANAGGVLAAATVLHLTPSAVSQHIARLEAETGVTLLDRSRLGGRRAAGLTPAGRLLAAHATRLAETLATAERELAALTGQVTGPVSVGALPTAIRHLVAPAAAVVAATNPNVEVRIRQLEREPGLAALQAGGLDLLIMDAGPIDPPANQPGLRAIRLRDDPFQIVFPEQWAPVAGIEALLTRPWVDGPPGSASHRALNRIAARYDAVLDRVHECLEFPATLAVVAAGLAAAVVPTLALQIHKLTAIEALHEPYVGARRIDMVHRHGRHEPSPATELVAQAIFTQENQ
ncbi:DNA-binding transcriptional LysR family regulator [Micromonospora sp. Llam0]|uniref:LysR family transcriptional regulator n=1 Tax=Micromonospora sp. Llam0 TaxID=2485143 RepID=UPI000F48AF82|nr:LysR family transcriptional regulator [Micromonospora sp. Llam0]ROO63176.1 DNA-binding transcriptional LysR family regulator [Micromonospora sp. Llam0]